jgi:hypothetical protein
MEIATPRVEIKNGITSELAGAVVGSLAAAISLEDGMGKSFAEARMVACAANCVDGFVLKEDERFPGLAALHLHDQLLLERESGFKREATGKEDFHRRRSAAGAGNLVV